ncbi:MAG: phytanoyl-CoA dioxygenase [Rickettsiales bacterium]|jgi:non-heme Fe2+,alpha-ketoglutarate-dependent halogenase|nr:phytanoyl-CoA dioxygenase [Rickettsiales bacterium]
MGKLLTEGEVAQYRRDGFLFPKRLLRAEAAANYLSELESYEAKTGGPVNGKWRYKSHLVFTWINELMRSPKILDAVEDLLGPNLMIWSSHLYPKEPGDGRFISWHQDSAHWGLDSDQILTVWIALTEASKANGCMQMLPGSHTGGLAPHRDTWDANNILTRGQTIDADIDESEAVWAVLQPGEVSLHHVDMWHASKPNKTNNRRVGVAFRYITPAARQERVNTDFATLLRGEDKYGHFQAEVPPVATMHPDAVAEHQRIANIQGQIYLSGTDRAGVSGLIETNEAR